MIGADGVHSGLRALTFGEDPQRVRHLGVYVAYWSAPNHLGLEDWALAHDEPERSAWIRPVHGNQEAIVYVSLHSPELVLDHRDVAAQKRLVRGHRVRPGTRSTLPRAGGRARDG